MTISDVSPPVSLAEVFLFDKMMMNKVRDGPIKNLVKDGPYLNFILSAGIDPLQQFTISFLMACHRIMSGSINFEEAILALQPVDEERGRNICYAAFKNSLRAISCARCLNWIDFSTYSTVDCVEKVKDCIEMHEHMHYSRYIDTLCCLEEVIVET